MWKISTMAGSSEHTSDSELRRKEIVEADAASEALVRFTQSAQDCLRYRSIYIQGAEAKKALALKEVEIREKDRRIQELDTALTVWIRGEQKEVARMKLEKAEIEKERLDLETKLKQTLREKNKAEEQIDRTRRLLDDRNRESANLQKELIELKERVEKLKADLSQQVTAKEHEAKLLGTIRTELGKYTAYTADLINIDRNE
jgi:predicted RNase H-like nuclease (RuvC/YqgF family)